MSDRQQPWLPRGGVAIRSRGRLPHWETDQAVYFVTFRLADSLPAKVLSAYLSERDDIIRSARSLGRELTAAEVARLDRLHGERVESYLDSGAGACHLRDPRVAGLVKQALLYFHAQRYRLVAWCVMPNHVHVVLRQLPGHGLAEVLHSWKSFTASKANALLGLSGAFWQHEYYDHLVRDEAEYYRVINYVLDNPVKAGLTDWPWCGHVEE